MNRKGELTFGGVIILFVGIIFALALLTPIADTVGGMRDKQTGVNESISVVSSYLSESTVDDNNHTIFEQSVWKQTGCPLESVVIRNGAGTAMVLDSDYTLYAGQGVYSLLNGTNAQPSNSVNQTFADFTYCLDGYNKDSGSRAMLNLILIFSTLIILAFALEHAGILKMDEIFK